MNTVQKGFRMNRNKFLSFILILLLSFNIFTIPTLANEIMPCWENIYYVELVHGLDNGKAGCYIYIDAYTGTNKIDDIDISLYQIVGNALILVAHWDDLSVTGDEFTFYEEAGNAQAGNTYRLAITANVHRYGYVERLDTYSDVVY